MVNGVKKICVIDSVYTFMVFMLINIEHYKDFFYVFWRNVPDSIFNRMPHKIRNEYPLGCISNPYRLYNNYRLWRNFNRIMTQNSLWGLPACGQDHLPFSRCLLNFTNVNFEEYEDGLENYNHQREKIRFIFLRRLLFADRLQSFAFANRVLRAYLTHPELHIDPLVKDKVVWIDLKSKWDSLTIEQKEFMCDLFDMRTLNVAPNRNTLIITRPLAEDGICSEEDKIRMIGSMIEGVDSSDLVIKPHYRERTNYKEYFKGVTVLNGKFPIELFLLKFGGQFSKILSVGKSSVELFVKQYYPNINYKTI